MYYIVKALPQIRMLYGKYSMKQSGQEANIAQGEAECYILSQDLSFECYTFSMNKAVLELLKGIS